VGWPAFEAWHFGVGICLGFGAWDLVLIYYWVVRFFVVRKKNEKVR